MTANPILLQKKYSRVIACFAKRQGISLDAALEFFYHSEVYQLIRDGVSVMQLCTTVDTHTILPLFFQNLQIGTSSDSAY